MARFLVEVTLHPLAEEVQAETPEDALAIAQEKWCADAANLITAGTFSVNEIPAWVA